MSARGFNVAQEGHVVLVIPPGNITGGATGQAFGMRLAAKANIVISWGALSAAPGNVQLFACQNVAGLNPVAVPFDRFQQLLAGPANDVLQARQQVPATGYVPSDVPNTVDVLHIQADQMPQGYPYLQLVIGDGTNTDFCSAVAVLTGVAYQGDANQTVTV